MVKLWAGSTYNQKDPGTLGRLAGHHRENANLPVNQKNRWRHGWYAWEVKQKWFKCETAARRLSNALKDKSEHMISGNTASSISISDSGLLTAFRSALYCATILFKFARYERHHSRSNMRSKELTFPSRSTPALCPMYHVVQDIPANDVSASRPSSATAVAAMRISSPDLNSSSGSASRIFRVISRKALRWELSDEPRSDPTLKEMFKNCTQLREWKFFTHSAYKFFL